MQTVDDAMRHVSWVGVAALVYVALQARAVLAQPRGGVVHSLIEILVSLLPLFVVGYAAIDWLRVPLDLESSGSPSRATAVCPWTSDGAIHVPSQQTTAKA